MADIRTDHKKAEDAEATLKQLADIRRDFEEDVDTVIKFVNHSRRRIREDKLRGKRTGIDVYDGTALRAKNLLVDGMVGYTCSRNDRWFAYSLPGIMNFPRASGNMRQWSGKRLDAYPEVKIWLEEAAEVAYFAFHRSNFYDVMPEFVSDGATAGTAHLNVEEDVGKGRIVFTVPHFRECYIAEDQYGRVDVRYRVYPLTLRQLADKFGMDVMKKAWPTFERDLLNNPYDEREIIHAVHPRREFDPQRLDPKSMQIASLWVLRSPLFLLREGGYNEMPAITWRWRKNSDEYYGRGPGWDAISETLTSQQAAKDNLDASHKMVRPPLVVPADLRGKVNSQAGGHTYVTNIEKQRPQPLMEKLQLPFSVEMQDRLDKAIKEHFHVDFFLMLYQASFNKVELTATQVLGMQGEQAAVLGTRVGRLGSEAFDPTIDRVFAIEVRAGRMPEPPQMLLDMGVEKIEVDYLGPLAQAQRRLTKSREIRAGVEAAAMVGQVFPESVDVVDGDETMKEALDAAGFPAKCILPDETVREVRMRRSQEKQAMQEAALLSEAGRAMPGLAKGPEPGSALEALTGAVGGEE